MAQFFQQTYASPFGGMNNGAVTWLSSDEVLVNFESYCIIFHLSPFSLTLSEKWPHTQLRLMFDQHRLNSIMFSFRQSQNLPKISVTDCRRYIQSQDWKIIHDVFVDPLVTADDVGAGNSLNQVTPSENGVAVFNVADGQILLYACINGLWTFIDNLTAVIIEYLARHQQITSQLKLESKAEEPVTSETAAAALYYRRATRLCSTKFWFWTFSTSINVEKSSPSFAVSIQRDNSLITWISDKNFSERSNTKIVSVILSFFGENVSAGVFINYRDDSGVLIVGTNEGNLFWTKIKRTTAGIHIDELSVLITCNDNLRINCLKFKELDNNKFVVIAGRQSTILVATISVDFEILLLQNWSVYRTKTRFPLLDVLFNSTIGFFTFSRDSLMKFDFETNNSNKLSIEPVKFDLINENEMEILGVSFSPNETFLTSCLRKQILDRYDCKYPYSFNVVSLRQPEDVWQTLFTQARFAKCGDFLVCIREALLRRDLPKTVLDDIECSLTNVNEIPVWQLKIIRHAVQVLQHRRDNTIDEHLFWHNNVITVERPLITQHARNLLDRWKMLPENLKNHDDLAYNVIQSADYWLVCNDPNATSIVGDDYAKHFCPICNSPLSQWSDNKCLEKICQQNHTIPLCCVTLMPLTDFVYRKCNRCELFAIERDHQTDTIKLLLSDENLCPLCDGFLKDI